MADQTQPQDATYSTPGIDPLLSARLHLEAAFNQSCKVFEQHIADVQEFGEKATKLLTTASNAMEDLRKAFIDFEAEQQQKIQSQIFGNYPELFSKTLQVDSKRILFVVQDCLKEAQEKLRFAQTEKDSKVNQILAQIIGSFHSKTNQSPSPVFSGKSNFDINKTRKLAQFGSLSKEYDFEWPSRSEDIEPSKDGTPVRIVSISYKASQAIMLGGIKIELSNGQHRTFLAHGVDGGNLNRLVFDYPVRSVFGDQPGNGAVSNLFFMSREKEKQTSINLYPAWKSYTPEQVIGEKEQLIGVYGRKSTTAYIEVLGFIVYTPSSE